MNQPIDLVRRISLGDYIAMVDGWREAMKRDDEELPPPDPEWWEQQQLRMMDNPHLTGVKPN
jgi:hypothetical protein